MSIFTAIFGDPQAQQAKISQKFALAVARLKQARAAGNHPAELAALAEMRRLSATGHALSQRALAVVSAGDAVGAAANTVVDAVSGILTSGPVLIAGASLIGFLYLTKR